MAPVKPTATKATSLLRRQWQVDHWRWLVAVLVALVAASVVHLLLTSLRAYTTAAETPNQHIRSDAAVHDRGLDAGGVLRGLSSQKWARAATAEHSAASAPSAGPEARSHRLQLAFPHLLSAQAQGGSVARQLQQAPATRTPPQPCDQSCEDRQRAALLHMYAAAGGPGWNNNSGWSTPSATHHCNWHGVACCPGVWHPSDIFSPDPVVFDPSDNSTVNSTVTALGPSPLQRGINPICDPAPGWGVVALILNNNNLSGSLPESVVSALADTLVVLDVHSNKLTGSLPSSFEQATLLQLLHASNNGFHGPFPEGLHSTPLAFVDARANRLTGTIPSDLGNVSTLTWLDLSDNLLVGSVPAGLVGHPQLKGLMLHENQLSGSIPAPSLAEARYMWQREQPPLVVLSMASNHLTGSLPAALGYLALHELDLESNQLTGPLPPALINSVFLITLLLDDNHFSGRLPPRLEYLKSFHVARSNLSGPLPSEVALCRDLVELDLEGNMLTGAVPDTWTSLEKLKMLNLAGNPGLMSSRAGAQVLEPVFVFWSPLDTHYPGGISCDRVTMKSQVQQWQQMDEAAGVTQRTDRGILPVVNLDPRYFHYETCICGDDMDPVTVTEAGLVVSMQCVPSESDAKRVPGWGIAVIVLGLLLLAGLCVAVWVLWSPFILHRSRSTKKLPPGTGGMVHGKQVTLVLTDVEGSTELWEWDTEVMNVAIDMHDRVLRSTMSKFFGYEVMTEGDAFLVAFHEPFDAVAWCIATQLALHNCAWPTELFKHQKACIETVSSLEAAKAAAASSNKAKDTKEPATPQGPASTAGSVDNNAYASNSGNPEGMASPGSVGGSIHRGTLGSGPPSASRSARRLSVRLEASMRSGEAGLRSPAAREQLRGAAGGRALQRHGSSTIRDTPTQQASPEPVSEPGDWHRYIRQGVIFRGLRVRMGASTGSSEGRHVHQVTQRVEYAGEVFRRVQAVADLPNGGQILLDSATFKGVHSQLNQLGARVVESIIHRPVRVQESKPPAGERGGSGLGVTFKMDDEKEQDSDKADRRVWSRLASRLGSRIELFVQNTANSARLQRMGTESNVRGSDMVRLPTSTSLDNKNPVEDAGEVQQQPVRPGSVLSISGLLFPMTTTTDLVPNTALGPVTTSIRRATAALTTMPSSELASLPSTSNLPANTGASLNSADLPSRHGSVINTAAGAVAHLQPPQADPKHEQTGMLLRQALLHRGSSHSQSQLRPIVPPEYANPTSPNTPTSDLLRRLLGQRQPGEESSTATSPVGPANTAAGADLEAGGAAAGPVAEGVMGPADEDLASSTRNAARRGFAVVGNVSGRSEGPASSETARPSGSAVVEDPAGIARGSSLSRPPQLWGGDIDPSTNDDDGQPLQGSVDGVSSMLPLLLPSSLLASAEGKIQEGEQGGATATSPLTSPMSGAAEAKPQARHLRDVPRRPSMVTPPHTMEVKGSGGSRLPAGREGLITRQRRPSQAAAVQVVDMGIFELVVGSAVEYNNIIQVLVPGLEERARLLPHIDTTHQMTPGYLDAPDTLLAPLGHGMPRPKFPEVTLVFCAMEKYQEMMAIKKELAKDVLDVYNDCIRRSLLAANGYECQEMEGAYMIVFQHAEPALEWCLMVQELMMEVRWRDEMLALPNVCPEWDLEGNITFKGPRVKMGIYKGIPTKVMPHSTTGRADYFGPMVNRAARFCHAAAQGGQVVAARDLVEEVLRGWMGSTFMEADKAGVLPVEMRATVDNAAVNVPPWSLPADNVAAALHTVNPPRSEPPDMSQRATLFSHNSLLGSTIGPVSNLGYSMSAEAGNFHGRSLDLTAERMMSQDERRDRPSTKLPLRSSLSMGGNTSRPLPRPTSLPGSRKVPWSLDASALASRPSYDGRVSGGGQVQQPQGPPSSRSANPNQSAPLNPAHVALDPLMIASRASSGAAALTPGSGPFGALYGSINNNSNAFGGANQSMLGRRVSLASVVSEESDGEFHPVELSMAEVHQQFELKPDQLPHLNRATSSASTSQWAMNSPQLQQQQSLLSAFPSQGPRVPSFDSSRLGNAVYTSIMMPAGAALYANNGPRLGRSPSGPGSSGMAWQAFVESGDVPEGGPAAADERPGAVPRHLNSFGRGQVRGSPPSMLGRSQAARSPSGPMGPEDGAMVASISYARQATGGGVSVGGPSYTEGSRRGGNSPSALDASAAPGWPGEDARPTPTDSTRDALGAMLVPPSPLYASSLMPSMINMPQVQEEDGGTLAVDPITGLSMQGSESALRHAESPFSLEPGDIVAMDAGQHSARNSGDMSIIFGGVQASAHGGTGEWPPSGPMVQVSAGSSTAGRVTTQVEKTRISESGLLGQRLLSSTVGPNVAATSASPRSHAVRVAPARQISAPNPSYLLDHTGRPQLQHQLSGDAALHVAEATAGSEASRAHSFYHFQQPPLQLGSSANHGEISAAVWRVEGGGDMGVHFQGEHSGLLPEQLDYLAPEGRVHSSIFGQDRGSTFTGIYPGLLQGRPEGPEGPEGTLPAGDSVHGADEFSVGLPFISNHNIRRRLGYNRWVWCKQLLVEDLGMYRFKGVVGLHSLVSVSTLAMAGRRFAPKLKKGKGERTEPGKGRIYVVDLQPKVLRPGLPSAALLEHLPSFTHVHNHGRQFISPADIQDEVAEGVQESMLKSAAGQTISITVPGRGHGTSDEGPREVEMVFKAAPVLGVDDDA